MEPIEAISPIDGRYRRYTSSLENFSEKGLISYRIKVEGEYLISLSENQQIDLREFSPLEKELIRGLSSISTENAKIIKTIETKGYEEIPATNHDVKAVEYWMKKKLKGTSLEDSSEWLHFALTSEDTNNLAYAMMLSDGIGSILLPATKELQQEIDGLAKAYADLPMLARTHGQPASPTTLGKEFKVFASRLEKQILTLENFKILVKLNGATGNHNAHHVVYPTINWINFTDNFISKLN